MFPCEFETTNSKIDAIHVATIHFHVSARKIVNAVGAWAVVIQRKMYNEKQAQVNQTESRHRER